MCDSSERNNHSQHSRAGIILTMTSGADPQEELAVDLPHRELVETSARFAHAFTRWVDAGGPDGLRYPSLRVLESLHCDGPSKMKALADDLGLTARNLTTVADSLENDGLVRRVAHPTDRRATLLELTPAGLAAADESLAPRLVEIGRLFDELTPEARRHLLDALTTLVEAMNRGCSAQDGC
jgi:DNA-binding MarR family transcriptional regulator